MPCKQGGQHSTYTASPMYICQICISKRVEPEEHAGARAGHRKAVSYVRYLNENELVSASTDSTLRLWNIEQHAMTRLFEGHLNEKNFVGLSADGEFIACGSELNEVRLTPFWSEYFAKSCTPLCNMRAHLISP